VIVLVVLLLGNFVLLGLCYFGYAGQAKLQKEAADEKTKAQAAQKRQEFAEYTTREWRAAVGNPMMKEGPDEANFLTVGREKLARGEYKDQFTPIIDDGIKEMRDPKLLGWDPKTNSYKTTFKKKVEDLQSQLDKARAENVELKKNNAETAKKYTAFQDTLSKEYKKFEADLEDGKKQNKVDLEAQFKQVDALKTANAQLKKTYEDKLEDSAKKIRELEELKGELYDALEKAKKQPVVVKDKSKGPPPGPGQPQGQGYTGKWHALLLDISKGHPLWDDPKGKILKIDLSKREVIINLGYADGVQKELTFNVFGAGWNDEGTGPLKGTIEVITVLNASSSLARITSMFDSTGKEIPLFDVFKGAGKRAADNPMKTGDVLYNVFWKSRVALAGRFNFADYDTPGPAEDARQLKLFVNLLKKQGMIVDAYLDPTTAQIQGEITPRTHFLIMGEPIHKEAFAGGKAPNAELLKKFNDNMEQMKKQAVEKGLFLISSYNFAFVIGFRPPQSADSTAISSFQATTPDAGGSGKKKGGPTDEKKTDEKKMPEKMMEK
jgi:hypothetical protein